MIHRVFNLDCQDSMFLVDDEVTLEQMKQEEPKFFQTPHGKRETYTVYKGCIIVRNTVRFTNATERRTAVYLYHRDILMTPRERYFFCISAGSDVSSITGAKGLINYMLKYGKYKYGFGPYNPSLIEENHGEVCDQSSR